MKLDRVTITGADDSVDPARLFEFSRLYPFVEWGILFGSREGVRRFPSRDWMFELEGFCEKNMGVPLKLAAHLCGRWVRDFVENALPSWWRDRAPLPRLFRRVQLNFHGRWHQAHPNFFPNVQSIATGGGPDFIFQVDGVNDGLAVRGLAIRGATRQGGIVSPLFDQSGGAGLTPAAWPAPFASYNGYAGGLGPKNVAAEIQRIASVVDATPGGPWRVWIDMERKVRSEDDARLDLEAVAAVLEAARPFVALE